MRRIYKYQLTLSEEQTIYLPAGTRILSVDAQRDELTLWALIDPQAVHEPRRFAVHGTGHDIAGDGSHLKSHLGTVLTHGGTLVWHVFEV